MISTLLLILQLFFFFYILFLVIAFITGAPFVPSTDKAAESMVNLAHIKPGMKVYDLGSGNGKLLFLAAEKGARAIGFEINPFLVVYTFFRIIVSPYRHRISVYWKNFWHASISDADIVYMYLIPWKMDILERMLQKQLKSGTLVVSNSFIFRNWRMIRKDDKNHIFVFQR